MSLQVWLPLTKDLRQQGLLNSAATVTGTTTFAAGKLGQALNCNGSSFWTIPNVTLGSSASIACWCKTTVSGKMLWVLESDANNKLNFYWSSIYTLNTGDSNNNPFRTDSGTNINILNDGEWHHFVITFDGSVSKLYIDGNYTGKAKTFRDPTSTSQKIKLAGGYNNGHSYDWNGMINDFRVYDHCLSPMEVKQLSQGLVLHYPLNHMGLGPSNLLYNGFGEFGTENWSNPSNIYDEVPPEHPEIKKSFGNNTSLEYIKLKRNHTYKITGWVKAVSGATGNVYPSILDYDVDKLQIANQHCQAGFNLNTMTTLTQQLNPGDNKIYVASLANWNANSGHHYNYAAIFGYQNSKGYTYPDGFYTRNIPAFGSGTNAKVNLDKTNNIITLNAAYSGVVVPIGTKICASTAGSTYFYPWGAINLSTITDWTYKEGTFTAEASRLAPAEYMRFFTYSGNIRVAGVTLTDITVQENENNIEYDCSGFCNNLNKNGTYTYIAETPKYDVSTKFNGTEWMNGTNSGAEIMTLACWAKTTKSKSTSQFMVADYTSNMCISFYSNCIIGVFGTTRSTGSKSTLGNSYKENDWNHFVVVKTGTAGERAIYCNGELLTPTSNDYWGAASGFFIGSRNNSATLPFYGQICDVRAYATALSAEDVKSLYQNCATIDPDGTIRGQIRS